MNEFHPNHARQGEWRFVRPGWIRSVDEACDRWLRKRGLIRPPGEMFRFGGKREAKKEANK